VRLETQGSEGIGDEGGGALLLVSQFGIAMDGSPQFDPRADLVGDKGVEPFEMADDDLPRRDADRRRVVGGILRVRMIPLLRSHPVQDAIDHAARPPGRPPILLSQRRPRLVVVSE